MKKRIGYIFLVVSALEVHCDVDFNTLLNCNLLRADMSKMCDPQHELNVYQQILENEQNYPDAQDISAAKKVLYVYPDIHPTHQSVLNVISELNIQSVCEIGAGYGEVSKYIFNSNPSLDITCVEHNKGYLKQLKEHFENKIWAMPPHIYVKATAIHDSFPYLNSLKSDAYDLVFTCAVMMHIPFIAAARSAIEIVRVSKKYILHVENKNDGNNWYNMAVITPAGMSSFANNVGVDYVKLYERLGVKTIKYAEYQYPDCPGTYVVYLGEKCA